MSWDLWLLMILVVLAASGLIVPVLIVGVSRARSWYGYRHLRRAYLPLDRSCPPWRSNVRNT